MWILDRYVLKEVGPLLIICAVLFTFVIIIDRIYKLTELVVVKGVPFHLVAGLLVLLLPSILSYTLPVALLVAVLLAGFRLSRDLEVVAFKASGVSPFRLFYPFLLAGLLVAGVTEVLTLTVAPWASRAFQSHLLKILHTRVTTGIQERVFNTAFSQLVFYVEELTTSQLGLRGVLMADERNPELSRIITARHGRLLSDEENNHITFRFIDGALHESDTSDLRRYRYTTFGFYDLNLSIHSVLSSAPRMEKPERDLSLQKLLAATRQKHDGKNLAPYEVELHKRFALPLAALVFTLLAFALGTRSHRGGYAVALGGGLAIIVSYHGLLTSLARIAAEERMPSWLAIWAPNLLFGALGLVLLRTAMVKIPTTWTRRLWSLWARSALGIRAAWFPARPSQTTSQAVGSRIIDRYLIREYLTYFGYGLAVEAVLIVVGHLLTGLNTYLKTQPPLHVILEHLVYVLPGDLYRGLPIVTLVTTIFLFLSMARQHELTALKAAGISLYRITAPILLLTLGVSVASVAFQEMLLPMLEFKAQELKRVKIRGLPPRHLQRQTQLWYHGSDGDFFRIELLDPVGQVMDGVTVLQMDGDFRIRSRLDAQQARWAARDWEFREGIFRAFEPRDQVEAIPFGLTALALRERLQDFTRIHHSPDEMSFLELRAYLNRLEERGHRVGKYLVKLYSKLSFPLIHVIIPLLAIPCSLMAPGRSRTVGVALAIAITLGYWLVHALALSLAKVDMLPPLLAAWTANTIFAGVGVSLFLRART